MLLTWVSENYDDGSNNLLHWQNRMRRRPARASRITTCPTINNQRSSGVDSRGARAPAPEFKGSEEKKSLISAYWSLAITPELVLLQQAPLDLKSYLWC